MVTEASAQPLRVRKARRDTGQMVVHAFGLLLVAIVLVWLGVNLVKAPDTFFRVLLIGISQGALLGTK